VLLRAEQAHAFVAEEADEVSTRAFCQSATAVAIGREKRRAMTAATFRGEDGRGLVVRKLG
jgi:hypothetical protein